MSSHRSADADVSRHHAVSLKEVEAATEPATPPLVDAAALAATLRVSRWSIYRAAAAGTIPSVRVGRSVRFELAAVLDALRRAPASRAAPASLASGLTRPTRPSQKQAAPIAKPRAAEPAPPRGTASPTTPPQRANDDLAARRRASSASLLGA